MSKPVGGRGRKAPYETVLIRVPKPIKEQVERLSDSYRSNVAGGNVDANHMEEIELYSGCLKLVNKFIEESGQSEKLNQRNNVNLVRFQRWLQSKTQPDS